MLRSGFAAALVAYALWGILPLYWPLLEPAGAIEILMQRIIWSLAVVAALLAATQGFRWVRGIGAKRLALLALAAALITINWGLYIYAVNAHHVVETSLGYFINPLVTVGLAVLVVGERLRSTQWLAIAIAAFAVIVLTVAYGRPPWIALALAFSFAFYGLTKKTVGIGGTQSIAIETTFLLLPALAVTAWLQASGRGTFTSEGVDHTLLLIGGGVVTAVPLVLFGAAAVRVPLATIGMLQYVAPILQFAIGVGVKHEEMPVTRLAGFALVWVAIVILTVDGLRARRLVRVAA